MSSQKNKIYGVTGANGFIGKKIVSSLSQAGFSVIAFGRGEDDFKGLSQVEYIKGDLKKPEDVNQFISRIDVCIHLAGVLSENEHNRYSDNVLFADNLAKAIFASDTKVKVLNVSSLAVFNNSGKKILESTRYSRSKAHSDLQFTRALKNGLYLSTLYLGLVYGEGDKKFMPVIVKSLQGFKFGGLTFKLIMFKGSKGPSPLISVDDVTELIIEILNGDRFSGERFLGIGSDKSLYDSFCLVSKYLGLTKPAYIVFKMPMLIIANLIEKVCGLVGKSAPLFISVRTISVLGLSLDVDKESFDKIPNWTPKKSLNDELPRLSFR